MSDKDHSPNHHNQKSLLREKVQFSSLGIKDKNWGPWMEILQWSMKEI